MTSKRGIRGALMALAVLGAVWLAGRNRHRHRWYAARPLFFVRSVRLVLKCRACPEEVRSGALTYAECSVVMGQRGYLTTTTHVREWETAEQSRIMAMLRLVRAERMAAAQDAEHDREMVPHG